MADHSSVTLFKMPLSMVPQFIAKRSGSQRCPTKARPSGALASSCSSTSHTLASRHVGSAAVVACANRPQSRSPTAATPSSTYSTPSGTGSASSLACRLQAGIVGRRAKSRSSAAPLSGRIPAITSRSAICYCKNEFRPQTFLCTDLTTDPLNILCWFAAAGAWKSSSLKSVATSASRSNANAPTRPSSHHPGLARLVLPPRAFGSAELLPQSAPHHGKQAGIQNRCRPSLVSWPQCAVPCGRS